MMLTPVEEVEKTPVTEETLPAPVEAELPVAVEPPGEAAPVEAASGEAAPGESVSLDDDAAFAWMESLAVRQGADEALLLKPEERLETPPDWVQQAAQEAGETAVVEEAQAIDEAVAEETSAEIETEAAVETPQTPGNAAWTRMRLSPGWKAWRSAREPAKRCCSHRRSA